MVHTFLGFVLISGVGWFLDLATYAAISQLFAVPPSCANFISSLVGVTYVWMVALNRLFERSDYGQSVYLIIYWSYQGISILAYSALISTVLTLFFNFKLDQVFEISSAVMAKIIITPPNLLTNFFFMYFLSKFMKPSAK